MPNCQLVDNCHSAQISIVDNLARIIFPMESAHPKAVCVVLLLVAVADSCGFRYDGFSVIDILPQRLDDVALIRRFAKQFENDEISFQFVRPPYRPNSNISVIASPWAKQKLLTVLNEESISFSTTIENYQSLIDREFAENRQAIFQSFFRSGSKNDHVAYMRYQQIEEWIDQKVRDVPHARFVKFGETYEKRKLFMVKISKNKSLPIIWLDAGIHAREWIATSSALYIIDQLLKNTSETVECLSKYQVHVVPIVNPDGYEYSHETNRLWRKNRAKYSFSKCVGVDMNRNFPFQWGGASSSSSPCDDQYRGPNAGSEKEIQAVIGELTKYKDRIKLVISLHAFGQYILQPFGYSSDHYPLNYLDMTSVALSAAFEIQNKHNVFYLVGRPPDILYPASGSSDDFVVGILKIPFSFTIELPDQGMHGFTLPPRFIKSVGSQLWDIFTAFATETDKLSY